MCRWFMPFNILITFIVGSILGWIVVQFTRPPAHLRGLIVGCCAAGKLTIYKNLSFFFFNLLSSTDSLAKCIHPMWAGNLGNMPLIIIPAVCKEKGSPFGSPDACHSYGMAYASLSMAVSITLIYSSCLLREYFQFFTIIVWPWGNSFKLH